MAVVSAPGAADEAPLPELGRVVRVAVRTGRHVDCVRLEFEGGAAREYGNPHGGEQREPFDLNLKRREYIVRVQGRQHKHLDAVQFVTNLGRCSHWYGGDGGYPFQKTTSPGTMVVGLVAEDTTFCPQIFGLREGPAPKPPPRIALVRLLLHPNVHRLVMTGSPSMFKQSREGSPSALRLLLRRRALMFRVMLRGKPSFLRLILDGEQLAEPQSLFRGMCSPVRPGGLSAMQMMACRDKKDKSYKSLQQLLLLGSPSVARQFFGTRRSRLVPLFQLLFEGDPVNGYPSLVHLLTARDSVDGIEQPSVFEASLEGEQFAGMAQSGFGRPLQIGMLSFSTIITNADTSEDDDAEAGWRRGSFRRLTSTISRVASMKPPTAVSRTSAARKAAALHSKSADFPDANAHALAGKAKSAGTKPANGVKSGKANDASGDDVDLEDKEVDDDDDDDDDDDEEEEEDDENVPPPYSLMRLMLMGQPSLFDLMMEGERQGRSSILRRFVEDRTNDGRSLARMVLTNFEDHSGHRPALSAYIFGGEDAGRPSLLRMLIGSEARDDQISLMRLLFLRERRRPGVFRSNRSLAKQGKVGERQRSLMDLLTDGTPSIADVFFHGELEGEDSLARLMLGTCVDFSDGTIKLGETLKRGNENGISLMQWMLVGEDDAGISFIRLLLYGEEEGSTSILRLLLMNENTKDEVSLLRILLTTLKAILIAAKTRPSQIRNGEWRKLAEKVGKAVLNSQKEGATFRGQFTKFAESLNPNGEQMQLFLSVLRTIPSRGKEFQAQWKKQWLLVASEIDRASKRAKKKSIWKRMGPTWKRVAEHLAYQRFAQLAAEVSGFNRWTEKIRRAHVKVTGRQPWFLPSVKSDS